MLNYLENESDAGVITLFASLYIQFTSNQTYFTSTYFIYI